MEFYPDVYKRACSKLNAPPDAVKEAIRMTEQKRRPRKAVRNLLVTAAILALAVLAAVGASAAPGGSVFTHVTAFMRSPQQLPETQGKKCLVRMQNEMGDETEFLAERVEYLPESNMLKVWLNTPDGDIMWLGLSLDESCRQYGSYEEMRRQEGAATGVGPDGTQYEVQLK